MLDMLCGFLMINCVIDWNFKIILDLKAHDTGWNIVLDSEQYGTITFCVCFSACYPYYQEDPFIISEYPDIYFAGNQPHFQSKLYEGKC